MLKPTTDPNASDARRDVAPAPRRPAHRHHRPAAGEQQPHGRGHAAARPRHRGAGRTRHHLGRRRRARHQLRTQRPLSAATSAGLTSPSRCRPPACRSCGSWPRTRACRRCAAASPRPDVIARQLFQRVARVLGRRAAGGVLHPGDATELSGGPILEHHIAIGQRRHLAGGVAHRGGVAVARVGGQQVLVQLADGQDACQRGGRNHLVGAQRGQLAAATCRRSQSPHRNSANSGRPPLA